MISFWQICSKRHAAKAFSGEGAKINGGRWNSIDVSMSYAAEHLSLAALELFVHVAEHEEPSDLMAVQAKLNIEVETIHALKERTRRDLPNGWQYDLDWTRAFGNAWIRGAKSLVLPVPSAIIPEEWNLLMNPEHPDFAKVKITSSREFRFDKRMFKQN